MRTRSSSNPVGESSSNPTSSHPKRRNRKRSKQSFILEESVDTMADQGTMAKWLRAPTEGHAEAILVPLILAEHFELKHNLITMITSDQFFRLEKDNPQNHIRWFNKITSTIKYKDVPNSAIKLMLFPFSLARAARRWLKIEPPRSILTWEDLVSKFINKFFSPLRTTNLRNEIYNFQQRFDESFHEAWDRYKDLLHIAKLTHAVNQQTSVVTTAMTAILKQFQATPPTASVKSVEEIYVTCGGAYPYYQCLAADGNTFLEFRDNIQGYVSADAVNLNQDQKMNEINIKAMKIQVNNVKNELRNEMKTSIQASMSNQTNELKNMMASFFQMNTASTLDSGPLPSNTIPNPKGELKAITTQSGLVLDGPSVPMPPPFINSEEDKCVEETLTDSKLGEFTIKVPPPLVQKAKPPFQRNYVVHQRDPLHPNILILQGCTTKSSKTKMKSKFITLLSNKEKLLELANTPLNENCSAVILKKLPKKLRDLGKFIISCGFSKLKCNAQADLGASINLMPLSVWKKLGLPELISTRKTLELANRAICTLAKIARDVFVLVGKFTFLAVFVILDYESDPRVPLVLGRPFLRTAHALIDVHGEEMILRDGYERLTLNMRHDTSSYSNQPQKESINMINIYNDSCEDYLEDLFATNHPSGNPTFSSHTDLTSPEVKDDIFDPKGEIVLIEKFLNLNSTKDLPLPHNINPLSGSTTFSSLDYMLEEFVDELALIIFPPGNDDLPFDIASDLKEIEYLLNHDPNKEMDSILKDSVDEGNLADPNDNLFDTIFEIFTDKHAHDYLSPPLYDDFYDDLDELESNYDDTYNDPFDFKEDKIKGSKLLIDELDPPRLSDFLPSPEYDSFLFKDFSEVDALTSTNNEEKVFNLGILIHENHSEVTVQATPDKNIKKITISHASLILEDFDPPLSYELPFHK
nr:hypothetical protein [Tanacetum cinerariifolium]